VKLLSNLEGTSAFRVDNQNAIKPKPFCPKSLTVSLLKSDKSSKSASLFRRVGNMTPEDKEDEEKASSINHDCVCGRLSGHRDNAKRPGSG